MQLPHAEHQVTEPSSVLLDAIRVNSEPKEMELAASVSFMNEDMFDEGESLSDIYDNYALYFEKVAEEICEILGHTIFRGHPPEALKWAEVLGTDPNIGEIAVWEKGNEHVYLGLAWEDKDCPIVVLLGKATKTAA